MSKYALPNESDTYTRARRALLAAEMALRDQREQVAELRRKLPPGPVVPPYTLREGPPGLERNATTDYFDTNLEELFSPGQDTLIIIHFMFGADWEAGCPMCSLWADGYNALQHHLKHRTSFAVVARCELQPLRAFARERGWRNLRLLSSHDSSFTADFGFEVKGEQLPGMSVFQRDQAGRIRLVYSAGAIMAEGQYRGMDLLNPVWHFFDLLPAGRGEWYPTLDS